MKLNGLTFVLGVGGGKLQFFVVLHIEGKVFQRIQYLNCVMMEIRVKGDRHQGKLFDLNLRQYLHLSVFNKMLLQP